LRENGNRPFFLFVHTYDAHDRCPMSLPGKGRQRIDSSPEGRKRFLEYYDAMIAKADGILGGVLAEIESLAAKRRIIVAVTSDHGEALWEHAYVGHSCQAKPYDPLTRVPVVIRPSGNTPARIATPVSVASIAPTLLELVGLSRAPTMVEPLLPGLGLDSHGAKQPIHVSCRDQLGLRFGRYKLVSKRNKSYRNEVYDLVNDPAESENVVRKHPEVTAQLRQLAAAYWKQTPATKKQPQRETQILDETTRGRLRALG
jgi:arylsulfatase A-like enzyme